MGLAVSRLENLLVGGWAGDTISVSLEACIFHLCFTIFLPPSLSPALETRKRNKKEGQGRKRKEEFSPSLSPFVPSSFPSCPTHASVDF